MVLRAFAIALLLLATRCFAAGGTCPSGSNYPAQTEAATLTTLSSIGITSCFFISPATGSDSNAGTSEGSPWAHMPGQHGCSNTCNSTTPAAGEGFIFRGGETTSASGLEYVYSGAWPSGTSAHPIYIGVDPAWYTGSSWARPIFTCGSGSCGSSTKGDYFTLGNTSIQYVIIDDLEFTGLSVASEQQYISLGGSFDTVERSYFHGWTHVGASSDNGIAVATQSGVIGLYLRYNVCDGSDTTEDSMGCWGSTSGADNWEYMYGNVAQWIVNGQNGNADVMHDNYTCHIPTSFNPGHQNAWQIVGSATASNVLFYNNVLCDVQSGGDGQYWWGQGDQTGTTWYEFDNIEYDTSVGNNIDFSQSTSSGTHNIFNNTFECGSVANGLGACINTSAMTLPATLHLYNNHCLTNQSGSCTNGASGSITLTEANTLAQTLSQADANTSTHFDQYTETQPYPFSPVASTNSTVGAGANKTSLCTTISGINSLAGTACQSDTGYACAYNTSSHTVSCPDRTENARPSSAAWDIGAYEYVQATQLSAPTGLMAVVEPF